MSGVEWLSRRRGTTEVVQEKQVAAEQLASAKGEKPLAQKRKALALQVLFVVETRGFVRSEATE